MNQLCYDKILYRIGVTDDPGKPIEHAEPGKLFDEIMSLGSAITVTGIREKVAKRKRPKSIHVFEKAPPGERRPKKMKVDDVDVSKAD